MASRVHLSIQEVDKSLLVLRVIRGSVEGMESAVRWVGFKSSASSNHSIDKLRLVFGSRVGDLGNNVQMISRHVDTTSCTQYIDCVLNTICGERGVQRSFAQDMSLLVYRILAALVSVKVEQSCCN